MAPKYTSDVLFHFVGGHHPTKAPENYDTLSKIIRSECVSPQGGGNVRITTDWSKNIYSGELLDPTVTCYADIPFESLSIHTKKYGEFGLGFDRLQLALAGARPVTYRPYHPFESRERTIPIHGRVLVDRIVKAAEDFDQIVVKELEEKPKAAHSTYDQVIDELSNVLMRDVADFLKPFKFTDKDNDSSNVYTEREWRRYADFNFDPKWVRKVVVAEEYVTTACKDFPQYADRVRACPR